MTTGGRSDAAVLAVEPASIRIVVLNWNGAEDTLGCLASLRRSTVPVYAIVVDNGSSGADVEQINESGLADVIIPMGTNLGYAEGNNVGLRHALKTARGFDVIGVLNNDTIADPNCFGALIEHLEGDSGKPPRALAPTTFYFDKPDEIWFSGGVVDKGWPRHLQVGELPPTREPLHASEWLTGCCIVARASTWRSAGLFDPSYFLIFEDGEWSLRARKAGIDLYVVASSRIQHKVSRSFSSKPAARLGGFYFVRNGIRFDYQFARRHIPRFVLQHLIRPTLSDLRKWDLRLGLGFRWLGALAAITGRTGRAPDLVVRLAERGGSEEESTFGLTLS